MPSVQQDHLSVPSSSSSSWHQISPSTRPLNLEILEITSLSLTIALSLAPRPQPQQQLRHLVSQRTSQNQLSGTYTPTQARSRKGNRTRARSTDSDEELTAVEDNDVPYPSTSSSTHGMAQLGSSSGDSPHSTSDSTVPGSYSSSLARPSISPIIPHPSFKDLLSKGVVVTVNGKPWTMIVAHVDEDETHGIDRTGSTQESLSRPNESSSQSPPRSTSASKGRRKTEDAEGAGGAGDGDDMWLARESEASDEVRKEMDRAIVVIYGLEPAKEYEVDLKVIGNLNCGESGSSASVSASTSIITPAVHTGVASGNRSRANSLRSRPNGTRSRSSSLIQPAAVTSGATIGGGRTPPDGTAVAGHADFASHAAITGQRRQSREVSEGPIQELGGNSGAAVERVGQDDIRANHLRHLVQTATGEKEDLAAQLKKSRRESQKAEASLRSDIEALKKAMEKTTLPDQRSRQKSLALQEQVKQALAGAAEADKEQRSIEQGMDHLIAQEGEVKEEWEQAREERDKANVERERAMEEGRKSMAELDSELAAVNSKLEKQVAKRDRVLRENQDLQQKLEDVASARAEVEKRNEAINRQRLLAEDYPNVLQHASAGRPQGGTAGGWDNDDVWTVNPAAASRPNAARGPTGASAINAAFGGQTGMSSQPSYSSSDLHQLGRQAGPSYNARPFWPSNGGMPRASSGPSMPPVAAAALATQGIPKAATMGISHMGNPTGFFPVAAASSASSAAASLGRTYQNRPPGGSAAIGSISPLVANVNAAPFMPAQPPGITGDQSRQSSASSDQHTSLVPPQLQHRIFLPGNRRVPSPSATGQANPSIATGYAGKSNAAGNDVPQSGTVSPPAFPPLPSSKTTALPPAPFKANIGPGPSLASIVTRAIIPNNSVLHAGNQTAQHSPVHQHSELQSAHHGARPSPPSSRPSSFYGRGDSSDAGSGPKILLTPQGEDSDHFPPLPISPINAWGSSSAATSSPANNVKAIASNSHALSTQGSAGPWIGKVPSRRGSESAGFAAP